MTSEILNSVTTNLNHSQNLTMLKNGQYRLQNCLEKNNFYQIYQAINLKLNKPVIIYTLSYHLQSYPEFNHWKKQFFYYILLLRSCHHYSLPKIVDCFEHEGHPYLIYEYYLGLSLEELINHKKQPLKPQEAIKYIREISQVLKVLHKKGLVHQNLHPRHILLDQKNETIKLINFGFHYHFTPKISQVNPDLLKEGFAPLEQDQDIEKLTPATDIYSLSGIFFYLLTGKKPLGAQERNKIPWTDWQTFSPQFPKSIRQALLKGLSLKIENRCQSVEQWFNLMANYPIYNAHPNEQNSEPQVNNSPMSQTNSNIHFTNLTLDPHHQNEPVVLINQNSYEEDTNSGEKSATSVLNPPIIKNQINPPNLLINHTNQIVNIKGKSITKSKQSTINNKPVIKLLSNNYYELKELIKFMLMTGLVAASGGFGFACSVAINQSDHQSNQENTIILHNEQTFPPRQDWPIQADRELN